MYLVDINLVKIWVSGWSLNELGTVHYSVNTLLRRVEFGIWPKHHRKIWNLTRRSRVRFQVFLWCLKAKFQIQLSAEACLRLTPLSTQNYHSKYVEFEPNSHKFVKICENLAKMWCLSQTPQILSQTPQMLVKFHTFSVDDLGGEWCYCKKQLLSFSILTKYHKNSYVLLCKLA